VRPFVLRYLWNRSGTVFLFFHLPEGDGQMMISKLRARLARFGRATDGAVTADWVVLTALAVTLLSAGYGSMRDGATGLADNTSSFMTTFLD
jgi:hypothetical protein